MTRLCLALLLVLNVCTVAAQEHPFLSRFALTEGLGFVQLDWTMTAGNTCEGIDIYRSLDGSNFETVGTIPGICGDINSPVPFSWTDQSAPELTTVYYRLRLGLNGFSSVQRIDLQNLVGRPQWLYPIPAVDRCTLLLRVPSTTDVEVRLYTTDGRSVRIWGGLQGGRQEIDLIGIASGTYIYHAITDDGSFSGRMVIAR